MKSQIENQLKKVFDPEMHVNVFDLGLIYNIEVEGSIAKIKMTLTSAFCPAADVILDDIKSKVKEVEGITDLDIEIVWDPPWTRDMLSESARLELGFY